ncbi:MAG: PPC domain-containing DNA-binding protein [Pseudohongiellaceae bacterium]
MKSRLVNNINDLRTYVLIFSDGDEMKQGMMEFVKDEHIDGASFTAIGAFSKATLGYFDVAKKDYHKFIIDEQVEVLSLSGNVAFNVDHNRPQIHAHVVVGKKDGSAHGGHLFTGEVRPTLEVVVTETPRHLRRRIDVRSGLALIKLDDQQRL